MTDTTIIHKPTPRVLHLEDNETDRLLVNEMLAEESFPCEMTAVKTRDEFESALRSGGFDLIISDYTLPSFDGLTALSIAREISPKTPFIFFSGTIGEEAAVESLKKGATDYILKQKPHRLVPALRNALRSVEARARLQSLQNTLQKVEERFRIVARATNDVVWEWDIPDDHVWFSENFKAVYGHDAKAIGGAFDTWMQLIHPDEKNRLMAGITTLLASGGKVWWSEHRLRRATGSYAHVLDRASIVYGPDKRPLRMVGVTIDLTDRKQAEEKIREQAELLNQAQDAIIVCNITNGRVLYWNRGATRIYGWEAEEAIGHTVEELLFAGSPPPELPEVISSVRERGEWFGELHEIAKDGRKLIVQARASLIRDEHGKPKASLIINTDITGQKLLEEQLLRSQRLESLGVLVAGIAHDLNNSLSPILIGLNLLRARSETPENEGILNTMENAAKRSADMLRQMLMFARGGEAIKTVIQPGQLLNEMSKIIQDTFPKSIQCKFCPADDTHPVLGIPTQLHQVLLNLCVNARDAMPDGGKLTLATENARVDESQAVQYENVKAGDFACFTVTDTGHGIPPEQLEKVFQPFYTTKGPGKGTGLGLPTSLSIVQKHGGFITIQSRLGQGTEFRVHLPAATDNALRIFPGTISLPPGHGEHILLVDDEESILAIMRTALENYGYQVSTATSGPEAIARFAGNSAGIDLVITDVAIPFMDGHAIIAAMHRIKPAVKVILSSGVAENGCTDHDAFLLKPVTTEALIHTVYQVLNTKK